MRTALIDFDPTAATSGLLLVGSTGSSSNLGMVNDSQIDLTLQFADGSTDVLKANASRVFPLNQPTQTVKWTQRNILTTVNPSISVVSSVLFDATEDTSIWHMDSTVRQVNIGNLLTANQQGNFWAYGLYNAAGGTGLFNLDTATPPSGKTAYATGFDLTADFTSTGKVTYVVFFQDVTTAGGSMLWFFPSNTTTAVQALKTFPYPIPVQSVNTALNTQLEYQGTGTAGAVYYSIYGYFA